MRIPQLRYIVKVAELGSINEAAKHLYISQPSLSNAIKELESEMNIQIFLRSQAGVTLTQEGQLFLAYARQVLEQVSLLEEKFQGKAKSRCLFSVSAQHYAFAVHAFVELIREYPEDEYEFVLRETETSNIIDDVSQLRSELGIIYMNEFNRQVLEKILKEKECVFIPLFKALPHVFVGKQNPLAAKTRVTLADLEEYPYLSFEQGSHNSFYYAEEILSTLYRKKTIRVSDRATIFNLMIGLNGYTLSSGIISQELNDENIVAIPLDVDETMLLGWIKHKQSMLSPLGNRYLNKLKAHIRDYGFTIFAN